MRQYAFPKRYDDPMPPKRKHPSGMHIKHLPSEHPDIERLRARISKASTESGVYRWLDKDGNILYVGKAKNLRKRLRSYVAAAPRGREATLRGPWKRSFLRQIADFEVTVVNNEIESLILETNMIKESRPKYNVMMKDDKNYLFVRVTVQDAFPRVETVRRLERDGAKYFGPYMSSYDVHRTLDMLHEVLGYRACKESIDALNRGREGPLLTTKNVAAPVPGRGNLRPCLDSQIGRCNGLCAGAIDAAEYRKRVDFLLDFLKGNQGPVRGMLEERMRRAAADRKFEVAARLRDDLRMLGGERDRQIVTDTTGEDADIVAVAVLSGRAHATVLRRRNGRVIGDLSFTLKGEAQSPEEVLEEFLPQFYSDNPDVPATILVSRDFPERHVIAKWLSQERAGTPRPGTGASDDKNIEQHPFAGASAEYKLSSTPSRVRQRGKVSIVVPERGRKSALLELAEKNVHEKARQEEVKWETEKRNTIEAVEGLQKILDLPAPPRRIEGYDISHLGGTETVGSMVVMINGKAANDQYRHFTIHSMQQGAIDDYRALKEVLSRRLRHMSGGLQKELKMWEEHGVVIRKARKTDRLGIENLVRGYPENLSSDDLDQGTFVVATRESEIVGCCRIYEHPTGLRELRSVCVAETERGNKLGQAIIRLLLAKEKKEKTYIVIDPHLEQYYAQIGFRHVIKVPPTLEEKVRKLLADDPALAPPLAMMFDPVQHKTDASLQDTPSLLVIDGGKGQLNAAIEAIHEVIHSDTPVNRSIGIKEEAMPSIPVIGLAKREEEVFVSGRSDPLTIEKDSPSLFLLMRLRDEAHRFANRLREKKGAARAKRSVLDTIPSIGPQTRQQLLRKFKTIDGIRYAPREELMEVLNEEQYEALKNVL